MSNLYSAAPSTAQPNSNLANAAPNPNHMSRSPLSYPPRTLIDTPDILLQPVKNEANINYPFNHLIPPTLAPSTSSPGTSPRSQSHTLSPRPAAHHTHSPSSSSSSLTPPTMHHSLASTPPLAPGASHSPIDASHTMMHNSSGMVSGLPAHTPPPMPPGLEAYMQQQFPAHFKQSLSLIDAHDFNKTNKHQLPLARIKKIMKSDEDVRMISAEAPVLFAKACELFILDLSLRAWAHVEHSSSQSQSAHGTKRRTLQRNDIAHAIQNSELFDFLYQIVPIQDHNPEEEGTPPHSDLGHIEDEVRYNRTNSTPDILLQRPLQDPYGDALPPVQVQAGGRAINRAATNPSNTSTFNRTSNSSVLLLPTNRSTSGTQPSANTPMSDDTPLSLIPSPSNDFALPMMVRGTSLDPVGGMPISTPVFHNLPIELMPDTPSNQVMNQNIVQPPTPNTTFFQAQYLSATTPGNQANWLETPGTPQPTSSTPSSHPHTLIVNTPNYSSGYSAERSMDEEEQ